MTVTWVDAAGTTQTRELTINAITPTILDEDLPAGTVITITEGERPRVDTVVWGSIVISGDEVSDNGDGSAAVRVSAQQGDSTLVTVVNDATWAPGTFSIAKDVAGIRADDPEVPETVTVTADWVDADGTGRSKDLTLPTDGTLVEFGDDLPFGTVVTLTEAAPTASARFTWDTPVWSGDAVEARGDGSATVTIGAASVAEIALTNTVTPTLGSIRLDKELTGDGAGGVTSDTTFPVTLTWTDLLGEAQERAVEITPGAPIVIDGVPLGTEITIVEGRGTLADGLRWAGAEWSSDDRAVTVRPDGERAVVLVSGSAGTSVEVTLTNEIEKLPGFAATGGEVATWLVIVSGILLVIGAWVLLKQRSRRAS